MDKKKTKRTKSKNQVDGHGRSSVKKKLAEVTAEKEKQERLEAANILSSLKFMTPVASENSINVKTSENAVKSADNSMTYFTSKMATGISTTSTPSLNQGRQPINSGGVASSTVCPPTVLTQLSQLIGNPGMQQQILSLLALQHKSVVAKTQTSDSKVPSVVMSAEPSRLPLTLNPVKTVNKTVASALRHTVTQNTIRTSKDVSHNNAVIKSLNSTVVKSIKEKLQKKSAEEEANSANVSSTSEEQADAANKKKDTVENSLPLKKRRLVAQLETPTSDMNSPRLSDLTSAIQMENILNLARDYPDHSARQVPSLPICSTVSPVASGYRPVSFDPRTSLLVLSDLKAALTPDEDGDLPIHIAVVHENTELVKKFIDIMAMSGKSVDRYNKLQQTPLHLAVLVNKPDIVQALIGANADPNLVDRNGCTSVHLAITKQFFLCLKKIFAVSRRRVEVNTRNYEGYSPLHTCVELGDLKAVKFLNEKGAQNYINLNIQDGKAGRSVLFYATEFKRASMVEYLILCGVNVDLQNYAGVSALMTAQAGGFDVITQMLTEALENQKLPDDSFASIPKKLPIAPIPSKAKLIVSDSPVFRSRSNSLSFEGRPTAVSRTSSTSSSSPMDLSLHRKNQSPSNDSARRIKQNMVDADLIEITPISEADKLATRVSKEKHAQIIAALEGRNSFNLQQSYVTKVERPKGLSDELNNSVRSDMQQFYEVKMLKDINDLNNVKIKQEPPDSGEIWGQSSVQHMETDTVKHSVVNKVEEKPGNHINVGSQNVLNVIEDTVNETTAPVLQEGLSERTVMETDDLQIMPVLSRAVSLTEGSNVTVAEIIPVGRDITDGLNGFPIISIREVEGQSTEISNSVMITGILSRSQGSSSADKSIEMSMEVDTDSVISDGELTNSGIEEAETTKDSDLIDDNPSVHSSNSDEIEHDTEMDINAIEMDAEHEDDEDIEGSLVIDENAPIESIPYVSNNCVTKQIEVINNDHEDSSKNGNEEETIYSSEVSINHDKVEKLDSIEGQSDNCQNAIKLSQPVLDLINIKSKHTISDSNPDELAPIIYQHSKGIPGLSHEIQVINDSSKSQYTNKNNTESVINSEGESNCSEANTNDNSSTKTDSLIEKRENFESAIKETNLIQDSENHFKQSDQVETDKGKCSDPDEDSYKDTVFRTGYSKTLYVRDGDSYKPIKIFIDDSVQSSMLLQQMLERTLVQSGTTTMPLVTSDSNIGKSVNDTVLVQPPSNVSSSTNKISDHLNETTSNLTLPMSLNGGSVGLGNLNQEIVNKTDTFVEKPALKFIESSDEDKATVDTENGVSFSNPGNLSVQKINSDKTLPSIEPSNKELKTVASTKVTNPSESSKVTKAESVFVDHMKNSLTDPNVIFSTFKWKQKPTTSTSRKRPPTTQSSTSRKLGTSAAAGPQSKVLDQPKVSKVSSLLQNRTAVSTSEGTLTWVNPDIKSRLSKALQSPQRKLGSKGPVTSSDGEQNHQTNRGTISAEGPSENIQTTLISETRQKS